jgi:hypothetical protein
MKDGKNIEEWLMSLTLAERDKLSEEERQRVKLLQSKWRQTFLFVLLAQVAFFVLVISVFRLVKSFYPHVYNYLAQYLSTAKLSIFGASIILFIGVCLYIMREKWRLAYGLLEVAFAVVYGFFAFQKLREAAGYVESVTIVAAVYLVVRGVDNVVTGWKVRNENLVLDRQRLKNFIESGNPS